MPIPTPSDPQAAALLAHVLSQTQQNISFLAAQNYITSTEAADLITRLSQGPPRSSSVDNLSSSVNSLVLAPVRASEPVRRGIPPPPPRNNVQKARAIWAYNEDGREPNDLTFSAGEEIEIVDETNGDWWTGRCRGKQGLFPSNHVEKLNVGRSAASPPPHASSPLPMSMPMMPSGPPSSYYAPPPGPPQPWGNEKANMYQPPYAPPPPAPMPMQPMQPQAPVVQQAAPAEPKKSKFSGLGNTMANSAAGGVGFGAGAAIGGGIINAIF